MSSNNPLGRLQQLVLIFLVISSSTQESNSFVNRPTVLASTSAYPYFTESLSNCCDHRHIKHTGIMRPLQSSDVDGMGRGLVIQGIALAICVWFFSIPPEFRRVHWCFSDSCVANREKCYDCTTFSEWYHDVSDYYKNGGGIQFDFEVADETRAIFEGKNRF